MATTITPTVLSVGITETCELNNIPRGSSARFSAASIGMIFNNILSVTTEGTDLIQFSATPGAGVLSTASSGAGKIEYIRVSNLDADNYVDVTFSDHITPASATNLFSLRVYPYRSIVLGGLNFGVQDDGDADNSLAASGTIANIRGIANTAACDMEIYVASV